MNAGAAEPSSSWDGAEYEKISALQRGVGLAFIDALELDGVRRVLDVGCGDGYLTEQIAEHSTAVVVGVDSAPAMTERARQRESERLTFMNGDVTSLRFDEPFDLVISLNTLHWVLDLPGAFARLFAACAPGGSFACQLVGASAAPSIEDVTVAVSEDEAWRAYFRTDGDKPFQPYIHPKEDELRTIAERAGFRTVESSSWTEQFVFSTEEHFRRWCAAGMSVWTNRIPAARRPAFIGEVTARYSERHGVPPVFEFSQLRLSAQRSDA